ncbi:MAG: sugar phosphate isomerase/epimerase [Oscillospiraceae bacterium]|nr:sugar phosphate isomerase/epimerase [Oscillospiraceae bacterium]
MHAGVSTACLYPQYLEDALYELALNGITHTELFINADSDITRTRVHTLQSMLKHYGVTCRAVHPFTCPLESSMLFSDYERRVEDMIGYYRRYFEVMQALGAEVFVFHGNENPFAVSPEFYCERFLRLAKAGKEYGIIVAQENVKRCQSGKLHFLREMSRLLGEDAHFVLDVKQAVRAGEVPVNMLHMLGSRVCHVHISDHGEKGDCLPLGAGSFRIRSFLEVLHTTSPDSSVILELYRSSYRGISDLVGSYRMLSYMIGSIEKKAGETTEKP